ncbi:MAG TPA: hypothetical protein PKW32_06950, partial [Verrucomicrobiota bacterium]|nr:hypothetical protein [Verrucomicrobiota bacterium]
MRINVKLSDWTSVNAGSGGDGLIGWTAGDDRDRPACRRYNDPFYTKKTLPRSIRRTSPHGIHPQIPHRRQIP